MPISIRVSHDALGASISSRLAAGLEPVERLQVEIIRGAVAEQFDQEQQLTSKGATRWQVSFRVLRNLGGSPRVMDDTGAYRAAWTGKGVGGRSAVRKDAVSVGVDGVRFPRVFLFQGNRTINGVVPRSVGISQAALRRSAQNLAAHIATGATDG